MANKKALSSLVYLLKYKLGRILIQIINFVGGRGGGGGKSQPNKSSNNKKSAKTFKEEVWGQS